ncbi:HAD-IIB family hydrolase [Spiroplasma culicicola]|uniref:HAD family hydrolase n=1 Tax=Spiroplasma culicicola AES-1 TaxID=1276246 RepID=W6A6P0_9MOLU|nr:HAD family hydrolase [Spiroplasma culicicola]AHI52540.1 HAD family hydrolase [Spiroplasma culicicola AES-1]
MSNIKLIALDMDGTAYATLGNYVKENIEPINQAIKIGKKVVFVTGRPVHAEVNKFEVYEFDKDEAIIAGFNGALIFDIKNDRIIDQKPIPKELVTKVFEVTRDPKFAQVEVWGYSTNFDVAFVNMDVENTFGLKHETAFFHGRLEIVDQNSKLTDCFKFIVSNVDQEYIDLLKELGLEVAWHPGSMHAEVNIKGINKKYALEFLKDYYSLEIENILAMGDGANDIPMLDYAGLSIAPANANDTVKAHAKIVMRETNIEGAVARALYKYVLGE